MADIIQLRRDTAANWVTANPVLHDGEIGIETDTRKRKCGNGTTAWNSLPYMYSDDLDHEPTANSHKPVESGGTKAAIDIAAEIGLAALDAIGDADNVPTEESAELVRSGGVWEAIRNNGKGAFDISAYKAVGGVLAKFDDLAQALGTNGANVPAAARKPGMSVCFVLNSGNKYVQYRLMSDSFNTTIDNWVEIATKIESSFDIIEETLAYSNSAINAEGGIVSNITNYNIYSFPLNNIPKGGQIILETKTSYLPNVPTLSIIAALYKNNNYVCTVIGNTGSNLSNRICFKADPDLYDTLLVLRNRLSSNYSEVWYSFTSVPTILDGYEYKGIVSPTDTPIVSKNKILYLAKQAGTYTNFGGLVVTQGVNILKYDGVSWSQEQFIGIDDTPTSESNSLVKSNGVYNITKIERACNVLEETLAYSNSAINAEGGIVSNITNYNIYSFSLNNIPKGGQIILETKTSYLPNAATLPIIGALYKNNNYVCTVIGNTGSNLYNKITFNADSELYDTLLIIRNRLSENYSNVWYSFKEVSTIKDIPDIFFSEINEVLKSAGSIITDNGTIAGDAYTTNYDVYSYDISKINGTIYVHTDVGVNVGTAKGYHAVLYKNNTFVKALITKQSGTTVYDVSFESNPSEYDELLIVRCKLKSNYAKVAYTNKIAESFDDIILQPTTIFAIPYNSGSALNFFNRIYPEGILGENIKDAKLNGCVNLIADVQTDKSSSNFNINAEITANGYNPKNISINVKSTVVESAKDKPIRIMCIGDSLTDGSYPALVETMFKQYGVENENKIKCLMVGTKIMNSTTPIGSVSFTNRACNEGRASWSIASYLRHLCIVYTRWATDSETCLNGKTAWDSLGLGTMTRNGTPGRTYQNFVWTEENANLILNTCHGYYDADPTEELWNWLVNIKGMTTFTYDGVTYTFGASYSVDDNAAQIAAIKYLCENWNYNPFYDYATVQSTDGEYAFNFSAYLNKYKTLADDGTTRLVVGSTAGTLVENAEAFDVCTPTHVVIIMSENERNALPTTGYRCANDMHLCAQLIKSYSSSIKCGIGSTRMYGAFNPDNYNNIGLISTIGGTQYSASVYKRLLELKDNNDGIVILPVYSVQSVIGDTLANRAIDTLSGNSVLRVSQDQIHTRTIGYLDRAYLVTAWVISTL